MMFWAVLAGFLIASAISAVTGIPPYASLAMAFVWSIIGFARAVL